MLKLSHECARIQSDTGAHGTHGTHKTQDVLNLSNENSADGYTGADQRVGTDVMMPGDDAEREDCKLTSTRYDHFIFGVAYA